MVKLSSVNFCSCLALIDTYLLYIPSIPSLYHQSAKVISSCWNWIVPRTQWIRPYYLPLSTAKTIRTLFYPPNMSRALNPTLSGCRFWLQTNFLNDSLIPRNFPMDTKKFWSYCGRRLCIPIRRRHRVWHG